MPADYSRIHRLLKILTLIQGSPDWTPKRLALECGTTERTIYRDLKMLEGAGVPYFFDREGGGYGVRRDFFLPPVQLTVEEALALTALAEHVGGGEQVPFMKGAAKAIAKVRSQLPPSIRDELAKVQDHVAIRLAAAHPPEAAADVYELVRSAIATKTALRCCYESASGHNAMPAAAGDGDATFLFEPYALLFGQRAWYAVGRHGGLKDVRCLKLNRFTRCEPTDHGYAVPNGFSLEAHLGNAWRMIRGNKSYAVELIFDREFAETVADTQWHRTQEVDWHDDGTITFRCTVDGLDEIVWWVLSMGPHCTVRKPAGLAGRVRELAERMVQLYPESP